MRIVDKTGRRYGRLLVVQMLEKRQTKGGRSRVVYLCRCDCGNEKAVQGDSLHIVRSCGCAKTEAVRTRCITHGATTGYQRSPEYRVWLNAKRRCDNAKVKGYHRYGGRGITMCDEWLHDFGAFLSHIGPRPSPVHSLDRIDPDGNYTPGNVRWATAKEQANNRSNSRERIRPSIQVRS